MGEIARAYIVLGVEHILTRLRPPAVRARAAVPRGLQPAAACWTITAFTLAHSLTLALSALGWLTLRSPPVEATIALSIVLVAGEALHKRADAVAPLAGAGRVPVRARARPRLRRRAEGDRPAAEPSVRGAADVQRRRRAGSAARGRRRVSRSIERSRARPKFAVRARAGALRDRQRRGLLVDSTRPADCERRAPGGCRSHATALPRQTRRPHRDRCWPAPGRGRRGRRETSRPLSAPPATPSSSAPSSSPSPPAA